MLIIFLNCLFGVIVALLNKAGGQTTEDDGVRDVLYIAMAGTHQIWALYLKDSTWLKGGSVIHVLVNF